MTSYRFRILTVKKSHSYILNQNQLYNTVFYTRMDTSRLPILVSISPSTKFLRETALMIFTYTFTGNSDCASEPRDYKQLILSSLRFLCFLKRSFLDSASIHLPLTQRDIHFLSSHTTWIGCGELNYWRGVGGLWTWFNNNDPCDWHERNVQSAFICLSK